MLSRRMFLATAGCFCTGAIAERPASAERPAPALPPIPALPLSVAVAEEAGGPVCDAVWVDAQIARATELFDPLGVPLRKVSERALHPRFARMETRADRDALAEAIEARRINVMIVASLRDVDDPTRVRMGVHWRHRKSPGRRWIIVAANARSAVLAHELGHFFGLAHAGTTDNVMSYDRTGGPVFFDPAQADRIRASARRCLATKEIEPA